MLRSFNVKRSVALALSLCLLGARPGVLQASPADDPLPMLDGSWTLAVIPDSQSYMRFTSLQPIFTQQIQWLVGQQADRNIQFLLHEGDIVFYNNTNNPPNGDQTGTQQWAHAKSGMDLLNGVIPYAMATGNHDYGTTNAQNRNTQFVSPQFFGPGSTYALQATVGGFYDAPRTDNSYHTFTAGGVDYLVLAPEWSPRDSTVAWLNDVVEAHPDHRAIMVVHSYMNDNNQRRANSLGDVGTGSDPDGANDGEDLWQKLVKQHANFDLVFSGHRLGTGVGYRHDAGDHGNKVHQMLFNTQHIGDGGDGWLRLVEFHPGHRSAQVKTYSPYLDTWRTDYENQFTVWFHDGPPAAVKDYLAVHYTMDQTNAATQIVTNHAPGSFEQGLRSSTVAIDQPGVVGRAVKFDGTTDGRITVGSSITNAVHNTNRITMSAWVNPSFYRSGIGADSRHTIMGASTPMVFALYQGGNLVFTFQGIDQPGVNDSVNSLGGNNLAGGMTVPLDEWSHVTATRDGTTLSLYVNGVLVAEKTTAQAGNFWFGNSASYEDVFYVGYRHDTPARDFDGSMDDVGIWVDRALTRQEVALIAGLGRFSAAGLDSALIDDVLSVFENAGGSATAGGLTWQYTTQFAAPQDGRTLYAGSHYLGVDGLPYIILGGGGGAWTGVVAVPEPTAAAVILITMTLIARRRPARAACAI